MPIAELCKLCEQDAAWHGRQKSLDHDFLPDNGKYHFSETLPKQEYVEERMPGGKYYDDGEAWREMPLPMDSSSQLSDDAFFRYGDGIAEHGGRFLGQPTAHIREEMIDALRYNEMTEKQIAWLKDQNEGLEWRVAELEPTAILEHHCPDHCGCKACYDPMTQTMRNKE